MGLHLHMCFSPNTCPITFSRLGTHAHTHTHTHTLSLSLSLSKIHNRLAIKVCLQHAPRTKVFLHLFHSGGSELVDSGSTVATEVYLYLGLVELNRAQIGLASI